jgi:hypothetical protein
MGQPEMHTNPSFTTARPSSALIIERCRLRVLGLSDRIKLKIRRTTGI